MASSIEILAIVLGTLSPFALIGFIFYLYFKSRHKERLRLIEKGIDPSYSFGKGRDRANFSVFRYGLLFVAIGTGIIFGYLLSAITNLYAMASYISMMLLFGGGSLILSYFIEQKNLRSKNSEEK